MRYGRKDALDRFYTPRQTALNCIHQLDLSKYNLIVEPSAGDGSFVDVIKKRFTTPLIAIDIAPARCDIKQQDFFDFCVEEKNIIVIGNPPFGKQNNLALKFINHAANFAQTIAFILPLSFEKHSVQNKIHPNFHLEKSVKVNDISSSYFIFEGEDYLVPTVFQIWEKKEEKRKKFKPEEPVGFRYVKKDNANLCVRRVGHYAGKATFNMGNDQSHFFLQIYDDSKVRTVHDMLNEYEWKHENTVGPRTVTKFEINHIINNILKRDIDISE